MSEDNTSRSGYNLRSPGVKRLLKEASELREATELYYAQPLEDNLFEWHFTIRGPPDSDFEGGLYHGRIILPSEYPMKPPSILMLTPNGRFELGKKICLSISGHHPESWQPSWSIRTALLAIVGFMPTPGGGAIGALDYTRPERQTLAGKSLEWRCTACGVCLRDILPPLTENSAKIRQEAKELGQQLVAKGEEEKSVSGDASTENTPTTSTEKTYAENPADSPASHPSTTAGVPAANGEATPAPSAASFRSQGSPTPAFSYNAARGLSQSASASRIAQPAPGVRQLQQVEADRTVSTVLIAFVTLMLAALILRRFLAVPDWKLSDGNGDGRPEL